MWPHHQAAVGSLLPELEEDPAARALILGGSLAKGYGSPGSDIDGYLVVTDDDLKRRVERLDLVYRTRKNHCDYEGGYFDLKCVSRAMLEDAAARGPEPFRASFLGATVPWSRIGPLDGLLARLTAYPEAGHAAKVLSLRCHLEGMQWYASEAQRRGDAYLLAWSAARVALLAGRLILAHNRVLYPYHKWLMRCVAEAPDKPAGFEAAVRELVTAPSAAAADRLASMTLAFADWGDPPIGWWNHWIVETEWRWVHGSASLDDM